LTLSEKEVRNLCFENCSNNSFVSSSSVMDRKIITKIDNKLKEIKMGSFHFSRLPQELLGQWQPIE
jgi:hypothetical protein